MGAAPGIVIHEKYRLLERIGSGGMSEVYRAENTLIGRPVAVKLLLPERAGDQALSARLFREAQAVSRIRHPGIADVIDAGVSPVGPYLVMELLEGETASQTLSRSGPLSLDASLTVVDAVLDALTAAHEHEIIHRDLKPENIFFALAGDRLVVKLLDFGIAKNLLLESTQHTQTGLVLGTPDYFSPEQAVGEPLLDPRSDLFSVGVLLFELLTNVRPFHAPSAVATAYRIAHGKTPLLQHHGGPRSPGLQDVLNRALSKARDERFQTAAAFRVALDEVGFRPKALEEEVGRALRAERSGVLERVSSKPRDTAAPSSASRTTPHSPPSSMLPEQATAKPSSTGSFAATRESARMPPLSVDRSPTSRVPSITGPPPSSARALPSRFNGRFHARGVVLQAVDDHVKTNFAEWQRDQLLDALDAEHSRELREGPVQAIVNYPLECLTAYLDVITRDLYGSNPGWGRNAGDRAVDTVLTPLVRTASRPDEARVVLRRVMPACRQFFDFGVWELGTDDSGPPTLHLTDFEPASQPLRLWLVGVLEGCLRLANRREQLRIRRGDSPFSPQLVLEAHGR